MCRYPDHQIAKILPQMSNNDHLVDAISTNDISTLRQILETQDLELFSQIAKTGTPELARYLLSRYPSSEDHSQPVPDPNPTINPVQYLVHESAKYSNAALFRALLDRYPVLLSPENRNLEHILRTAVTGGGVPIWKVLLEHNAGWKDHEFAGHRGVVLKIAAQYGSKDLLEFLLKEGADLDGCSEPGLLALSTNCWGLEKEKLGAIEKYCK